jgi:hypothetical protein
LVGWEVVAGVARTGENVAIGLYCKGYVLETNGDIESSALSVHAAMVACSSADAAEQKWDRPIWHYYYDQTCRVVETRGFGTGCCAS